MFSVPLLVLILLIVAITVLAVKGGAVALRMTGLDENRAHFQALSAVTGTGFTTRESELVMADPRRRKIIGGLMIFGNVVLVTIISLLVGSFAAIKSSLEVPIYAVVTLVGVYLLYRFMTARGPLKRWGEWASGKMMARLKIAERPVHEVLAMAEGHGVAEVQVSAATGLAGKMLSEAGLRQAGLLVLAIRRGSEVLPSPVASNRIQVGDRLVCYGELARMYEFVHAEPEPASSGAAEAPAAPADGGSPAGEGGAKDA